MGTLAFRRGRKRRFTSPEDQTRVHEPALLGVRAGGRDVRESQAVFRCTACGYACNADVNAARNIAAGHAVTARGGIRDAGPVNREPQLLPSLPDMSSWNPPP